MAAETFQCPGCRETFVVVSPDGGEIQQLCPIPECRRVIWMRGAAGGGFDLLTDKAPDLSSKRFVVDCCRLLDGGAELLSGPSDRLEMLAAVLNARDPPEHELPELVRSFIQQHGRGCVFQPGRGLVRAGYALLGMTTLGRTL